MVEGGTRGFVGLDKSRSPWTVDVRRRVTCHLVPPLKDETIRACICEALSEWRNLGGSVSFDYPAEKRFLEQYDQRGAGLKDLVRIMYEHAVGNGKISQAKETREPWKNFHDYHYDFTVSFCGEDTYVETVLNNESRVNPPCLIIVNVHPAN